MQGALSLRPSYYEALRRLTLQLAGVRMGSDHAFLVETRLASLARREGYDSLDAMVQELFSAGQARLAVQVVSTLVERDTHFNSDPASLNTLFDIALRDLAQTRGGGRLDLLCHGCGSGQDVYSVAIRAASAEGQDILGRTDLHLTGVDYPSQALERAKAGRYTHFEVQRGLSARDMVTHFTPDTAPNSTDWVASDALRQTVSFEEMHLMSEKLAKESFHIVLFRGALSLYTHSAKIRLLRGLSVSLKPYGYLVLGSGEEFGSDAFGLEAVDGAPGLYRKPEAVVEPVGKQPTNRTTFDGAKVKRRA